MSPYHCDSWVSSPFAEKTWRATTHQTFFTCRGSVLWFQSWNRSTQQMHYNCRGPSLPVEKGHHLNRQGGVLWFQSRNPTTHWTCYNGHLLYSLRKFLTSNLSRWCVVVSIMKPPNTSDVLQWAPSLFVDKVPHLNPLGWYVVVPIMKPLNTSDVLQWVPSLPVEKGPHLSPSRWWF